MSQQQPIELPKPVLAGTVSRTAINISRLRPEAKKAAWDLLKQNEPELADWLKGQGRELIEKFQAEVLLD